MICRHMVRLDDIQEVLLDDALLLAEHRPQRVDVAVIKVPVAVRHATVTAEDGQQSLLVLADHESLRQPVDFRAPPHLVIPERHAVAEHRLDLFRRRILLLPRLLVLATLLFRFGFRRCFGLRFLFFHIVR